MSSFPLDALQPIPPDSLPAGATMSVSGDEADFRVLFDTHYGALRRYARSVVDDTAAAEDLVQEAFVRLWDRRASIPSDTPRPAYLYRTVRNLALNLRRDHATRQRLLDDPVAHDSAVAPSALPGPEAHVEGDEMAAQLTAYLTDLPPRQREAIHLARFEGLSHGDVAIAMGCSPRTVNNHLVAALSTLRRRFSEAGILMVALAWWLT